MAVLLGTLYMKKKKKTDRKNMKNLESKVFEKSLMEHLTEDEFEQFPATPGGIPAALPR